MTDTRFVGASIARRGAVKIMLPWTAERRIYLWDGLAGLSAAAGLPVPGSAAILLIDIEPLSVLLADGSRWIWAASGWLSAGSVFGGTGPLRIKMLASIAVQEETGVHDRYVGDVVELPQSQALEMIRRGYAEAAPAA